jgi:hypothetical protein
MLSLGLRREAVNESTSVAHPALGHVEDLYHLDQELDLTV